MRSFHRGSERIGGHLFGLASSRRSDRTWSCATRPIFDRADADKDGTVTKDELTALAAQQPAGGGRMGGPGGPGGRMGGSPKPGDVLSPMFRQMLNLTPAQQKEVDALQKDVDAKMAKILNSEQQAQLKEMRDRGPGRPGGPGGRRPGGEGPPNP